MVMARSPCLARDMPFKGSEVEETMTIKPIPACKLDFRLQFIQPLIVLQIYNAKTDLSLSLQ